jgi:hypothetical protein
VNFSRFYSTFSARHEKGYKKGSKKGAKRATVNNPIGEDSDTQGGYYLSVILDTSVSRRSIAARRSCASTYASIPKVV